MSEPPGNKRNEVDEPPVPPLLPESIEEALVAEVTTGALRSRRRYQESTSEIYHGHPRPTSWFSNLGDLPGLLRNTIGSIFGSALLGKVDSDHIPRIEDGIDISSSVCETWSEYLRREGEPRRKPPPVVAKILNRAVPDTNELQYPYPWSASGILNNRSTYSLLREGDVVLLEKQVITSELDAFITSLQQERKDFEKFDADESINSEVRRVRTQIKVGIALFCLGIIVTVNICAGLFLLWTHFF